MKRERGRPDNQYMHRGKKTMGAEGWAPRTAIGMEKTGAERGHVKAELGTVGQPSRPG